MKTSIHAQLIIYDFDQPIQEITSEMGIEPTKSYKKGSIKRVDPRGINPPILFDTNYWILQVDGSENTAPDELLKDLLHKIDDTTLSTISRKSKVELSIFGDSYDSHVGINIDPHILQKICNADASFDFSFYALNKTFLDNESNLLRVAKRMHTSSDWRRRNGNDTIEHWLNVAKKLAEVEALTQDITGDILEDLVDKDIDRSEIDTSLQSLKDKLARLKQSLDTILTD